MKLLIATTNPGKREELIDLLKGLSLEIVTPQELGLSLEIEESGSTYAENASLKAQAFCQTSGLLTLADDTGLEVDALGGRPGVYSARYVEKPGATDADRRIRLLRELAGHPRPWTAHFHCTVAVAAPAEELQLFDGDAFGEIIPEERGEYGFGYDCLLVLDGSGKTLAELKMDEKNRYSHRAKAVKKAIAYLNVRYCGS